MTVGVDGLASPLTIRLDRRVSGGPKLPTYCVNFIARRQGAAQRRRCGQVMLEDIIRESRKSHAIGPPPPLRLSVCRPDLGPESSSITVPPQRFGIGIDRAEARVGGIYGHLSDDPCFERERNAVPRLRDTVQCIAFAICNECGCIPIAFNHAFTDVSKRPLITHFRATHSDIVAVASARD